MKSNPIRLKLGRDMEKQYRKSKQNIWKNISEKLLASRKNRVSVNVAVISRNSKDGSNVVVPGKVLGAGDIDHKVTVVAFSFSRGAKEKIRAAGGKCVEIGEFAKSTTKVKDVLVLG
jgi:large subunit ribosomal protein L18e